MLRAAVFSVLSVLLAGPAAAATLTVQVDGIRSSQGQIGCALFSSAKGFPDKGASAATQLREARPGNTVCVFKDLRPGTYAVSVIHDLNGNGRFDFNLLGMPKEDWGISNNARPAFRAPRFSEAAFQVGATAQASIRVRIAPLIGGSKKP